jgi:hypothetical protein
MAPNPYIIECKHAMFADTLKNQHHQIRGIEKESEYFTKAQLILR